MGSCFSTSNNAPFLNDKEKRKLVKGLQKIFPDNACCKKKEMTLSENYFFKNPLKNYAVIQCNDCYMKYKYYTMLSSYSFIKNY